MIFSRQAHLVSHSPVIEHRGLDLEGWGDKDELHEGELVAALQRLRLHLHICPVDPAPHNFSLSFKRGEYRYLPIILLQD